MSLIHEDSGETVDSGLDVFSIPPTQTSIETGGYAEYFPVAVLNQSSNIEFNILNKNGLEYLGKTRSYILAVVLCIIMKNKSMTQNGSEKKFFFSNFRH